MKLTPRQKEISNIVEKQGPITGQAIAAQLNVTRAALRSDLAVLTMSGLLDARPKVGYYHTGRDRLNPLADVLEDYLVKDNMSTPVVVSGTTSVYEATVTMFLEDVGTLLVGDGEYLLGVISRKDLLRAVMGNNNEKEVPISMIMTPASKVIYATLEDTVLEAAQKLIDFEVDCLPVVEIVEDEGKKRHRIVGRLSKTNITKIFVNSAKRFPIKVDL